MKKSIIVAQSTNKVIGNQGALPWQLPADLAHFKQTTYGHPIIMGRVTFESIGRPLPGRLNIIVTRRTDYIAPCECKVAHSLQDAFAFAEEKASDEVFIIGGAEIYRQVFPMVDKIYMTQVHANVVGDSFFPSINALHWQEASRVDFSADDKHVYAYSFITYLRR